MLSDIYSHQHRSYGFRFKGGQQYRVAGIYSLGWEKQTSDAYDWNGLERGETGKIVFQYTLAGEGCIRIDDWTYSLKGGDAFLVNIPSNHRYYLPDRSSSWEFIYLTIYGREAEDCFETIKEKEKQILHLDVDAPPVQQIFQLLDKAAAAELNDAYDASTYAYAFIMDLYRHAFSRQVQTWPVAVSKVVIFIQGHFADPIALDDMVEVAGISKYHFTRLFLDTTQQTPIQYLTKVRINKAVGLLKNKDLTIDSIARQVGYANGNYFSKVFRAIVGISPGKYRQRRSFVPIDHLVTD